MDAVDRKNIGRAVVFAALTLVCGVLLSSYFLWELVDTANHLRARMTLLASVMMGLIGAFSLNAFAAVLRFGFVRRRKGAADRIGALVQFVLQAILALFNAGVLFLCVSDMIDTRGGLAQCLGTLAFAAVMIGGYLLLYRLSKKLKAERALLATFS